MPNITQFKTHEDYLNWYRNYRTENRLKFRNYNREYNKQWRYMYGYDSEKKWKQNNPEKVKAQQELHYSIRKGLVKKEPCQGCGSNYMVHGHHEDYSAPLDVIWLCPLCHSHLHIEKLKCQQNKASKLEIT